MRIHHVELTDFRGVENCSVEFSDTGVTIIEGDNEVGKSSIDEAIRLVLSERDDTSKAAVRDVQPVGRDVGPQVEIELSTGPYRLRCTKRFIKKSMTELEVLEPSREQLTGREAHDRLRAIIAETMDEALWGALRMQQGEALAQADFAGGSLGRALDLAAGGERPDNADADDLWQRIVAERQKYFTDTGRPRKNLKEADEAVVAAQQRVDALLDELRSLENDTVRVARLTEEARTLAERRTKNTQDLEDLGAQAETIAQKRRELELLESELADANGRRERAVAQLAEREALVERVATSAARVAEYQERLDSVRERAGVNQSVLAAANDALESTRCALRTAESDHRRALADRDHLRRAADLEELSARRRRVTEAVGRRQEARRVLESNLVDEQALTVIEDAHQELVKAEALAGAGSASLNLAAVGEVEVLVDGEVVRLGPDEQRDLAVSESMSLELPGLLRVAVTAGADAQQLARGVAEARLRLIECCETYGVPDVRTARKAAHERREAELESDGLDHTIESELRGSTPEEITAEIDLLVERVRSYPAERNHESPLPSTLELAESLVSEADACIGDARRALSAAESGREEAREALLGQEVELSGIAASLDGARHDNESASAALDRARCDRSDDQLTEILTRCTEEVSACTHSLGVAQRSFADDEAQAVEDRLQNCQALARRLVAQIEENHDELVSLRSRLQTKGEDGLAGRLDEARSELLALTGDRDRLHRRAEAARLLHDTFAARREAARRRYVAPLRDSVERLGRIVFGRDFEVELDEDLMILNRTLDGQTVPYGDLSTGTKEQLGMIIRLAAAEIVASGSVPSTSVPSASAAGSGADESTAGDAGTGPENRRTTGGAPVVFDDALGWSDPARLEGMAAVLSTAAKNCQVIVLTCTPGRYESVGNARVVRLPA